MTMTINVKFLRQLLSQDESYHLDFKERYWENRAALAHDVICLANSLVHREERYLILGIEDDTKRIVGIENDPNRKNKQQITDLLKNARINNIPPLERHIVKTRGHKVDVITIRPGPTRPYFFTEDYSHNTKTVRAGVIYCRDNDTNTPLNRSATPEQMTQLWIERFGLNTPPLRRMRGYIKDLEGWKKITNQGLFVIHYVLFPEFTISIDFDRPVGETFREAWSDRFPNHTASSYMVEFKYHTTILKQSYFVQCDGGRFLVPMPEIDTTTEPPTHFYDMTKMYIPTWRLLNHMQNHTEQDVANFLNISLIQSR
jgi:hypothetical protein